MKLLKTTAAFFAGMVLLFGAAACEGFYEDVPTATMGPDAVEPETGAMQGTRAERAETASREALAARLGVDPSEAAFAGLVGATWTRENPGCYPPPTGFEGDYLIPGLRMSLLHEGVVYEYHSNLEATRGSLCDDVSRTSREIAASLAGDVVDTIDTRAFIGRIVTIPDEAYARLFTDEEQSTVEIDFEAVDWTTDVLVGTSLTAGPSPVRVVSVSATWDIEPNLITIGLELEATGGEEIEPIPVWVLVEYPPPGARYEFTVVGPVPGLETPEE